MRRWPIAALGVGGWCAVTRWTETWNTLPSEPGKAVPGDDIIERPALEATRAVTFSAPPDELYRWLAQMGPGRAGWYSYDRIDNQGIESARRVHPEWVVTEAGTSMGEMAGIEFIAVDVEPGRHLVLSLPEGSAVPFTMGYLLLPWGPDATRLVVRVRADARRRWLRPLVRFLLGPADFVMMRRQFQGLAERLG